MRGEDERTGELFSYVDLEARVRRDHPLRAIRAIVNEALVALELEFVELYSSIGRPSIPPEKLLRAMLLQRLKELSQNRKIALLIAVIARFLAFSETLGKSAQTAAATLVHTMAAARPMECYRCHRQQKNDLQIDQPGRTHAGSNAATDLNKAPVFWAITMPRKKPSFGR